MDVKTIRRVRLTWLRDTRFGGVAAKLARAIDKSEAQVNQWLSGHRKISEDSAAHIESRLRQDPGSMGREPPATDIKHAIGLLIASWKAADSSQTQSRNPLRVCWCRTRAAGGTFAAMPKAQTAHGWPRP